MKNFLEIFGSECPHPESPYGLSIRKHCNYIGILKLFKFSKNVKKLFSNFFFKNHCSTRIRSECPLSVSGCFFSWVNLKN